MKFPFYSNYTIDDSDIGCHRVVYADCDGVHKYKTVCELFEECDIKPQLKSQCIVDFLNSNLTSKAGEYLKIDNKGCLTTGTPSCPCDDRKVGATKNDSSPGPLIDKLIGGCDSSGTYCISVGTPSPNTVQVLPSGPINGFTKFNGGADCDNAYVKMDKNGNVFTECPELKKAPRYAYCVHEGGRCTIPRDTTARIYAPNNGHNSNAQYNFSGTWSILATPGFARDTEDGFILIQEPGVYYFSFSSYVYRKPTHVHAIRAGLWVDGHEIGDFKYDGPEYLSPSNPYNKMKWFYPGEPRDVWGPMAIENPGLSFSGSYMFPILNASVANPVRVKFAVKPDTRVREHRMIDMEAPVTFELTAGQAEVGPKTVVTIMKVEESSLFDQRRPI